MMEYIPARLIGRDCGRTVDICLVNKCSRSISFVSGAVPSTGDSEMEVTFGPCPLGTAEGREEVDGHSSRPPAPRSL